MKLDFSKINEKVAVWCDTEEKAREFIKQAYENGYEWAVGDKNTRFSCYKTKTCYKLYDNKTIKTSDIDYFEKENYTIIPFNDLIIKEDKPISDYTIKEWQEHCKNTETCDDCIFKKLCEFTEFDGIENFDFDEKPRFASDEIEKLKLIKALYPTAIELKGKNNCYVCEIFFKENNIIFSNNLPNFKINSLKQGETINIDEVLKEYEV